MLFVLDFHEAQNEKGNTMTFNIAKEKASPIWAVSFETFDR